MEKLKGCPFCGHKLHKINISHYNLAGKRYYIVCPRCACHGPNVISEIEAIEAWNSRLLTPAAPDSEGRCPECVQNKDDDMNYCANCGRKFRCQRA